MPKTLLYRLFRIGKIPPPLLTSLKQEGILFLEEGVPGSATYRNFRAPGRYSNWRKNWYTASLILTRVRLVALHYSQPIVDVALTDERLHHLEWVIEQNGTLCVRFDPAVFHPGWSGNIEYRFRLEQARRFLDLLQQYST